MSSAQTPRSSYHPRSNSVWMTTYGEGEDEATFGEIGGKRRKRFDEGALARLGKAQELKRRFGFLSVFGFSCCILMTWEVSLALLQEPFANGGPAGAVWGYLLTWICSTSVYMCLAEMASMAPIAGGQYFWVAILSPPKYKQFLSYLTGWMTCLAWIATIGIGVIQIGTMIQGVITLDYPDYEKQPYQATLFSWAVVAVALIVNTVLAGIFPFLEGTILVFHILGYVTVMVTMLYLSPKTSASNVFLETLNLGKWPTQGLSTCIGLTGTVAIFVGADATVHMSEEIEDAAVKVPKAIFTSLVLNGIIGLGMIIAVLFCNTDIQAAIHTKTDYAFLEIIANGCGTVVASVLASIVIAMIWCAVIGFLATASRMIWSFARDKAIPFHQTLRKVHPTTSIPVYAVLLATVLPGLLALIYIGSPTAYSDVISMSVSGLYTSYLIPCALLLWRRTTGQIQSYSDWRYSTAEEYTLLPQGTRKNSLASDPRVVNLFLMWGPWRVPGLLGTLNNAFACCYCVFVVFWSFWPVDYQPTASTMNYSIASFVGVLVFSITWYLIKGHKEYKGPLIELSIPGTSR